jgi:monovalent cation/hydrogen antiporter
MSFFETLVVLLAVAIAILQIARRLSVPYPTMLAGAGVVLALVPGTPNISFDPHLALALFIAPALAEAAFDFPFAILRRYWRALFSLFVVAVLITAGSVAWVGIALGGLPLYAAITLGAIVAPPDAAAATAILRSVRMPRRTVTVLKGESLLNDALALMLFTAGLAFHQRTTSIEDLSLQLSLAAPTGILLGVGAGYLTGRITPHVTGTLGATLLEFISTFLVWIVAERIHVSAVLAVVAYGMTVGSFASLLIKPRMRIHSFAVWDTAVFLLNVMAFLLMGLQARSIVESMSADGLLEAATFAGAVTLTVVLTRMAWLLVYNRMAGRWRWLRGDLDAAPLSHGVLIGWTGMRGLVTLATAFALPLDFPGRDLIVLSAFSVVLATLVVQGLTLPALVRALKLDGDDGLEAELEEARAALLSEPLAQKPATLQRPVRDPLSPNSSRRRMTEPKCILEVEAEFRSKRLALEVLRVNGMVQHDAFLILQQELDYAEISALSGVGAEILEG